MPDRKNLIVIDDQKDFADFVVDVAARLGYNAVSASRAQDFHEQYENLSPDVIVLDIVMPDCDGIEIIRWLMDKKCHARLLITTGYGIIYANAAKMIGESEGTLDISILRKPVKIADLRAFLTADSDKAGSSVA